MNDTLINSKIMLKIKKGKVFFFKLKNIYFYKIKLIFFFKNNF
jgi:hypothetical protein